MGDQQPPLTAVLGELGQRDAKGFGDAGAQSASRPIAITDAEGNIVYEKRTADTEKAADSHIRAAGFQRTGEWADGVAPVERIPLGAKVKRMGIVLAVLAVIVVGVSVFVSRSYALEPEGAVRGCHDAVTSKLPPDADPEFKSTSSLKNKTQAFGGYLWVVNGEVRSLDIDGEVHDMTYRCEVYVDSSGRVHKASAGTTWK